MNIVFLDAKTMGNVSNFHLLEELGNYKSYMITSTEDVYNRIKDAEVVITCKVVLDRKLMEACPKLKLICVAATGTNNIDIEFAGQKEIAVKNVANYSTESVAQCTVGLILNLTNKIQYYDQYVKNGRYSANDMFTHYGPAFNELNGKRAGIIGLGNIGKRVAKILECFGMEIAYYSTTLKNNNNDYIRLELDKLLMTSDVISIHAPLNENTRNLLSLAQIKLMKPTAIIINTGRGGIINENDLADAINRKLIAGAGLDVYEKEPMVSNNPLLGVEHPENLILTPHIAWTSVEARELLIQKIAVNIKQYHQSK